MQSGGNGPLQGLRVVELGTLIAGPFAGRLLAEAGADVVKIESPDTGDPLRNWRKLYKGSSLWWYSQGRNKRSVAVDLRHPQGQEIVHALARSADIVIENFRPGQLEKWNLGYEEHLAKDNPALILVRISGYGQSGPYRDRPGFGSIGEAMGGLRYLTGEPNRPPCRVGISLGDSLASLYGVIGALMALRHRSLTGRGQVVDVALYESVFSLLESTLTEFGISGFIRERSGGALPGIAPSNTYACRDGAYVVIGANSDGIFRNLMRAIGRPDLASDPELADNAGRVGRAGELDELIGQWTAQRSLAEAVEALTAAGVPAGRIYSIADIVNDAHYQARGMIEKARLEGGEEILLPGHVPKLSETPLRTRWIGPKLGEHTAEVLRELGYTEARQRELRAQGVIA